MSPAWITRCSARGRKPTPPSVPDVVATLDAKAGTSPVAPGELCVAAAPAGPLSSVDPFPLPSKPVPVAIWNRASTLLSGPSPPKPGALRLRAAEINVEKPGVSVPTIGWFRTNGRPVDDSPLKAAPDPP